MNFPTYTYPPGLLARVIRDILLTRRRDFRPDAEACIQTLKPPLQILGKEWIPWEGNCVLTVNHYHRPGFGAQWLYDHAAVPGAWIGYKGLFIFGALCIFVSMFLLKKINVIVSDPRK